ncbi:hypothetical protein GCM10023331_30550 [Algivirga pacifica]|uniref:Lipoprotein n=2 Tax=Algivirga pacifica TaxID=1162670 RepID=A0ABP9DL75_9BACT
MSACDDKQIDPNSDYIVFGHAYGYCMGNCSLYFKAENKRLYKDNLKGAYGFPESDSFESKALDQEDYQLYTEHILPVIPSELLAQPSQTFGCPDCADQGGYILQYKAKGDTLKNWHLDTNQSALPEYLWELRDSLESVMLTLAVKYNQ